MAKIQPNLFESLLGSADAHLAGEMMGLMVSGKVKSPKDAKQKAQLGYTVEAGDIENLTKLLKGGASPNDPVFDNCLLTRAIYRGKVESLRLLLAHGANPNHRKGSPPLLQAILQHNVEAVRMLIAAGAEVNVPWPDSQPELLSACLAGNQEIVELLLSHDAQTNFHGTVYVTLKREVRKVTPLMVAAWLGKSDIVKCLLAAGSDLRAKDTEGCTALDWVERCRAKKAASQIAELLRQAGAEQGEGTAESLLIPPDFCDVARTIGYKKLVRDLSELTSTKAQRLEGAKGPITGGHAFPMSANQAEVLVGEQQTRFLASNAFIFAISGQNGTPIGDALAVLPTTDPLQVVAAVGTEGPNSKVDTKMIVEWLKKLDTEQSFRLIGISADFVKGQFTEPVKNALTVAKKIARLCPDAEETPKALHTAAQRIKQTGEFFLWWD
jgi:ankyrin repeat protein